jgi:thiamine-phosphate pyrophosphorylase
MSGSRNYTGLTPGAQRTLARCRRMATTQAQADPWAAYLVLTLLQDESLASACLQSFGITRQWIIDGQLGDEVARSAALADGEELDTDSPEGEIFTGDGCQPVAIKLDALNDPLEFTKVLDRATELARRGLSDSGVSSANLLLAVVETNELIRDRFAAVGVTPQRLQAKLYPEQSSPQPPLSVDGPLLFAEPLLTTVPTGFAAGTVAEASFSPRHQDVWRVLDASLNRAREGMRVLEDFARFLANDSQVSLDLKSLRHELVASEKRLHAASGVGSTVSAAMIHRDTPGDVGTSQSNATERTRRSLADVIVANSRRVQESLRSLEEFGKLVSVDFAASMKQLRYRAYTVEKSLVELLATAADTDPLHSAQPTRGTVAADARQTRLKSARLYLLITESMCRLPWQQVVEQTLAAGADILQLREKSLNDRELLRRARWVCDACHEVGALFIMNDRSDLAVASKADGLHIGQDEFTVAEARRILDPTQLIGVSTHNIAQASQAVHDGADYLGVGPVFPSQTKSFDDFPGLSFLSEVAAEISHPWFAIGGVTVPSLAALINAGASRVAVTSAIAGSECPGDSVREFQSRLHSVSCEVPSLSRKHIP